MVYTFLKVTDKTFPQENSMSTDAMKPHSCCAGKTDTDPTDQEPDTAHCPVRTTLALIGGK